MADAAVENQAVNNEAPNTESAPVADQNAVVNPPAESNSAATERSEQRIPYDRFSSVVNERNQERKLREEYEHRIRELESRLPKSNEATVDAEVQRLVTKLNMGEEAARELVESQRAIAQQARQEVENKLRVYEINEWQRNLSERHKDFREIMPEMEKAWAGLSPEQRNLVVSSEGSLELFFKGVKADVMDRKVKDAYNQGANQAYQNKAQKQAMSNVPGGAAKPANPPLSPKAIDAMSLEEYERRKPEINAWLAEIAKRR